jgi:hypothetical protein
MGNNDKEELLDKVEFIQLRKKLEEGLKDWWNNNSDDYTFDSFDKLIDEYFTVMLINNISKHKDW